MAKVAIKDPATGAVISKANLKDVRPYWLYDTVTISTTPSDVYAFQTPEGSDSKGVHDTNLKQFSTIQVGWQFVCDKIRVVPRFIAEQTEDAANHLTLLEDLNTIFSNGVLSFYREGDIEVWRAPLVLFTAGCGPMAGVSASNATDNLAVWSNGLPSFGSVMKLPVPIILSGGRTFVFKIGFPSGLSLNSSRKLWIVLDGMLSREVVGG